MHVEEDYLYAETHEWIKKDGESVVFGISDYAQQELTDVVYVELPQVGKEYAKGSVVANVESVKASSEIYAPVSCRVIEVNGQLEKKPELMNTSPYAEGWIAKLLPSNSSEFDQLLNAEQYRNLLNKK